MAEFRGDSALAIGRGLASQCPRTDARCLQVALCERLLDDTIRGLEPMALGGDRSGPVLIGSIGSSDRRSFIVLGDAVSVTLRIRMTGKGSLSSSGSSRQASGRSKSAVQELPAARPAGPACSLPFSRRRWCRSTSVQPMQLRFCSC